MSWTNLRLYWVLLIRARISSLKSLQVDVVFFGMLIQQARHEHRHGPSVICHNTHIFNDPAFAVCRLELLRAHMTNSRMTTLPIIEDLRVFENIGSGLSPCTIGLTVVLSI